MSIWILFLKTFIVSGIFSITAVWRFFISILIVFVFQDLSVGYIRIDLNGRKVWTAFWSSVINVWNISGHEVNSRTCEQTFVVSQCPKVRHALFLRPLTFTLQVLEGMLVINVVIDDELFSSFLFFFFFLGGGGGGKLDFPWSSTFESVTRYQACERYNIQPGAIIGEKEKEKISVISLNLCFTEEEMNYRRDRDANKFSRNSPSTKLVIESQRWLSNPNRKGCSPETILQKLMPLTFRSINTSSPTYKN